MLHDTLLASLKRTRMFNEEFKHGFGVLPLVLFSHMPCAQPPLLRASYSMLSPLAVQIEVSARL